MEVIDEALLESNWGGLAEEAAVSTQTLSELTAEAEACQLSEGSGSCPAVEVLESSESESAPPTESWYLRAGSPWWAYRLIHLTKRYNREQCRRPVNIVSGCTGISAESFVMKAGWGLCTLPARTEKFTAQLYVDYVDCIHGVVR